MKTLIIGAMDIEIETLVKKLQALAISSVYGNKCFYKKIDTLEVFISNCGIGKVNASAITQKLIMDVCPDEIINTGIAGSMKKENRIGDIIIGNMLTYHDVRQDQMESCFPFVKAFYSDTDLVEKFKSIITEKKLVIGKIVSGESFINTSAQKEKIIIEYEPDCVDMESAAIAHVAYLNNIPFIAIRAICDNADDTAINDFEAFEKSNAIISADIVYKYIKNIVG